MYKISIVLLVALFSYSCDDLNKLTEELKDLKNNQALILKKQSEVIGKLAVLESKIGKPNAPQQNKKNNKRKGPNPNYSHNIEIGNSVVLGNPNAKVTVTKFTDFQ
tara:strand:- start:152 stop:469 length:318 start_codon:yes stop_codon:yes gene_type:complete